MTVAARAKPTSIEIAALTLRAEVRADSVNVEERTVELVFSTGAPVSRYDWMTGARYIETLSLKPSDVRLDRLNNGAPFLNAHSAYSMTDVLGVVVSGSAKIADGQGRATVRFSKRDDVEPIWQDVQDGIIRNVSVGYRVHKYEQTEATAGTPTKRHAVDWEPYEISAVPMGADDGAKVRAADDTTPTNPCLIITRKESAMQPNAGQPAPVVAAAAPAATAHPVELDVTDPGAGGTLGAAVVAVEPTERDAGANVERGRIEGVLRAVRAARLPQSLADKFIREGTSLVDAQDQVLRALEEQDRGGPRVTAIRVESADPNMNVWRGIESALLHRVAPQFFALDELGRNYRGLSLLETAKVCLQARGIRTTGMSKMQIAGIALGLDQRAGLNSTSDYANILADVANKTLRRAYDEAPQTFMPITRRTTIPDFKPVKRNQLGEAPSLLEVKQSGEFTRGSIGEAKEQYALATFGRVFGITRQALINDDTDAFSRIALLFGRSARHLESDLIWQQITTNPNMGDGVALFHATHANLDAVAAAISVAAMAKGRSGMRLQKGVDNVQRLNIVPKALIVPTALETIADQFVSQTLLASQSSNVNPFGGKLQVIAEPRLDANSAISWYLAASVDQIDLIELALLEGEEGPVVETRVGFDVDGVEVKCRHDVAAKVIDWRGLWKNPGA